MTATEQQRQWLEGLAHGMQREIGLQRTACAEIWHTPLGERVEKGHSLGPLKVVSRSQERLLLQPADVLAEEAECSLREGDFVRLSHDSPLAPTGHFIHAGEDDAGIHLLRWKGNMPEVGGGNWVIDPDFFDMTDRFSAAIDALATTEIGRERILPLLMGDAESAADPETYDRVMDDLEDAGPDDPSWHDSQQQAIALCVAALDSHLVQGPPGTGKTRVLAEVVRRLIVRGERVLVTGPTHRAIHHALDGIRHVLPATVRVAKIGVKISSGHTYECFDDYAASGLADCGEPHVIGATPYALWGGRSGLYEARFDTVLLDEASQLTPLVAAMAMLRGERWLFFGDDCQLPPVVLSDDGTPPRGRSVFHRLKHRGSDTLLEETWRLNKPHAEWPSATFYGNRLVTRHDMRLRLASPCPALTADPALALHAVSPPGKTTVRSDEEAQCVVAMIREAVAGGVEPEKIGVITLFRAQAGRIRQLLGIAQGGSGLRQRVTVDTVERFQGQERDLIFISTASSDPRFIRLRADYLFQAERWNVAVTRARLKTILITSRAWLATAETLADEGLAGAVCFASLIAHLRCLSC